MKVSEFKAALKGGGARPNLFEVEMSFPSVVDGGAELTKIGQFLVKSTQLPASTIGVIEQPFRGRVFKVVGDRTFAEWTVTFINDTGFELRDAFEQWSNFLVSHEENLGAESYEEMFRDAKVFQLNRQGKRIKEYKFTDLWVSEVGVIELAQDSSNTIEEFAVTLQYTEWTSNTTK